MCVPFCRIFGLLLWLYKAGLLTLAAYLAVKTWKLHDTVAEAKPIAVSIYNIAVLVIVNAILYGVAKSNILSLTVQVCTLLSILFANIMMMSHLRTCMC
jgi:7 transmembrane sweet-taste receptor of 3 GCPR